MNFQDIGLIFQTAMLAVLLISMWFRAKGNYFVHGVTMIVAVVTVIVGVSFVFATADPAAMQSITSVPYNMNLFAVHGLFASMSLGAGVVLLAMWRPKSTTFPQRTKKIAMVMTVLWILTFVIGIVLGLTLHSGFFI